MKELKILEDEIEEINKIEELETEHINIMDLIVNV